MTKPRLFTPGFVAAVGPCFVAVDTVQPVAVVVSHQGTVVSVESWAQLVAPPVESPWPNRRFGIAPDRLLVQDLPDGEVVALSISPGAAVRTARVPRSAFTAKNVSVRHPRMIATPRGQDIKPGWRFVSTVHRYRRSATVEFRHDEAVWTRSVGRGSIVAAAQFGRIAAICLRRADQFPREFDPTHELYVVRADVGGIAEPIEIPPEEITSRCWPRNVDPAHLVELLRGYTDYLIGGARLVTELGARNLRLELRDMDSDPVIEFSFELPGFPGLRLVRLDKPVNELGHLAGLRGMNVYIEEDLAGGHLVEELLKNGDPVDGRLYF